jgi:hypothetical protein
LFMESKINCLCSFSFSIQLLLKFYNVWICQTILGVPISHIYRKKDVYKKFWNAIDSEMEVKVSVHHKMAFQTFFINWKKEEEMWQKGVKGTNPRKKKIAFCPPPLSMASFVKVRVYSRCQFHQHFLCIFFVRKCFFAKT